MTTASRGFTGWLIRWTALIGLAGLLVVGADRLVASLRRDVHAVLARPAPATTAAPEAPIQVARAERR